MFLVFAFVLILVGTACSVVLRFRRHGGPPVALSLAVAMLVGGLLALVMGVAHAVVALDIVAMSDCEDPQICADQLATIDRTPLRPLGASLLSVATVTAALLIWWRLSRAHRAAGAPPRTAPTALAGGTVLLEMILAVTGLLLPHANDLQYGADATGYREHPFVNLGWAYAGLLVSVLAGFAAIRVADASRAPAG
jgi:hypothetical protein